MGALLSMVADEQRLLSAWERLRVNDLADGRVNAQVADFQEEAATHLAQLAEDLAAGRFEVAPAYDFAIPKEDGSQRHLAIPPVRDRIVERAVMQVLEPLIDPLLSPWCFAYRRGLSRLDAIGALTEARDRGAIWVARADILDCFDHVPRFALLQQLREIVDDADLVGLVSKLVHRTVLGSPLPRRDGLLQGSALSPLLSNLYLRCIDDAVLAAGWQCIRYADDLAIPAPTRAAATQALADLGEAVTAAGLELNSDKSRIVSFDEGVPFLGEVVTTAMEHRSEELAHPTEGVVYVTTEGSLLRTRGNRLVVMSNKEVALRVSLRRVRTVVCFGRVGMTTPFVHRALEQGIDVVLLDRHGGPLGALRSVSGHQANGRRAQYELLANQRRRLAFARRFVTGKLANMRVGLLRLARRSKQPTATALVAAGRIEVRLRSAATAHTHAQLMGVEGAGSRDYFQALATLLPSEWDFQSRQRRPPPDPVNAMLSFGYTLLAREVEGAVASADLDASVGLLHEAGGGRSSLALDLMEELRPLIVDSVVTRVIGLGMLHPVDFEHDTTGNGCRLRAEPRRVFVAEYERRMLTVFQHLPSSRRVSYRVGLGLQARCLAAALIGGEPMDYQPIGWR